MIHYLLVPLAKYIESFRFFESIHLRALCAGLTAFLIGIVIGPGIIDRLGQLRWRERIACDSAKLTELNEKAGKSGTPTMGGMILVLSTVTGTLLFARLDQHLVLAALWAMTAMGVLGGIDDRIKLMKLPDPKNPKRFRNGMDAWPKIWGQIMIGTVAMVWIWWTMADVPGWDVFRVPGLSALGLHSVGLGGMGWSGADLGTSGFSLGPLMIPIGIFVLVATSNAVNLTDGMDGLAAGCGVIVTLVLAVTSYLVGHIGLAPHLGEVFIPQGGELSVFLCALAGGTGGFLWWNCFPARVFMGNTGSMALGGALAVAAMGMRQEFVLAVAGAAFVWEAVSVILQVGSYKTRGGKRIFLIAPYHHHLQFKGWPESRVVMSFWIGTAVCSVLALGLQRVL